MRADQRQTKWWQSKDEHEMITNQKCSLDGDVSKLPWKKDMFKKNCRKKNRQGRQKTNVKGQELGSEKRWIWNGEREEIKVKCNGDRKRMTIETGNQG